MVGIKKLFKLRNLFFPSFGINYAGCVICFCVPLIGIASWNRDGGLGLEKAK